MKETNAIVLDFLPNGYPFENSSGMTTPIAQALGKERFTLLELVPKKDIFLNPEDEVYIGDGKREEIMHIRGRLDFDKLTQTGQSVMEQAVKKLVEENPKRFIDFFNKSSPSSNISPLVISPGGISKSCNIDRASTVFPVPLSPIIPYASPLFIFISSISRTVFVPSKFLKLTFKSLI